MLAGGERVEAPTRVVVLGHRDAWSARPVGRVVVQQQPVQRRGGRVASSAPTTAPGATARGSARRRSAAARRRLLALVPRRVLRSPGLPAPPTSLTRRPSRRGTRRSPGSSPGQWFHAYGTSTTGNSRPLLVCTVRICTAAASESRRRLRSTTASRSASSRRRRSHALRVVRPSCPCSAASYNACAMCRRSVSSRSPPTWPSSRSCSRWSATTASNSAATPRSSSTLHQCRSCRPSSSAIASPSTARSRGGQPDEAAQRQPPYPGGPMRLLERLEQQLPLLGGLGAEDAGAAGDDDGDAGGAQVLADELRLALVRTSTAMSPGCNGRRGRRSAGCRTRRGEHRDDLGGQVGGDLLAGAAPTARRASHQRQPVARQHPQPYRSVCPRR